MDEKNQNLIPMSERSPAEVRELGRRGGIASGTARRRKRSMKEAADLYLSLPVSDRRRLNRLLRKGVAEEDADNQMAMVIGLAEAATEGDARAAGVIVKLLGEEAPREEAAADRLARAEEILGGIGGAIE